MVVCRLCFWGVPRSMLLATAVTDSSGYRDKRSAFAQLEVVLTVPLSRFHIHEVAQISLERVDLVMPERSLIARQLGLIGASLRML